MINTAQLRRAATGVARPYMRSHFPDSAKDASWRASVGLSYRGLTAEDEEEDEVEVVALGGAAIGLPDFSDEKKKDVDIAVALMLIS